MARFRSIRLAGPRAKAAPDAVAVPLFEDTKRLAPELTSLDDNALALLQQTIGRPECSTALGEGQTLYPPSGAARLLVVGLGKRERFTSNSVRVAAGKLSRLAQAAQVRNLQIDPGAIPGDQLPPEQVGAALADGLTIANEPFDQFKGAALGQPAAEAAGDLTVHVPAELRAGFEHALTASRGLTTARRLAATPPNVANPKYVVETCQQIAARTGLCCEVIDAKRAAQLNLNGLLAVGRAGSTPPAMIALEWPGQSRANKKAAKKKTTRTKTGQSEKPLMFVGKAITFDTGGYSLKPSAGMKGMKYDKCGGAAVIGAMEAIARLNLPQRVVGLVPCAENMIDEQAYRVDDILTLANGVTVEVTNTDAEGRLILADALAYGTKHYKPAAVVDLGTLTGGIVVALGKSSAGLFCPDHALRDAIGRAADTTGEKLWPMPLWDEHRDQMQSAHADIVNTADRKAHPIQCAAFLSHFVGDQAATQMPALPWAHLDIAGVADVEEAGPLYAKGPTGYGVRLLTELARNWKRR
jgi:leucyl aminopeptidase